MQATRLVTSFETLTGLVALTGEIATQSHMRFSVFFSEIPKSGRMPKC